jgi:hypothetical protein
VHRKRYEDGGGGGGEVAEMRSNKVSVYRERQIINNLLHKVLFTLKLIAISKKQRHELLIERVIISSRSQVVNNE